MAKKLRPCPFCGEVGIVRWFTTSHPHFDGYGVVCQGPRCFASGPMRKSKEGAINAWNRRILKEEQ